MPSICSAADQRHVRPRGALLVLSPADHSEHGGVIPGTRLEHQGETAGIAAAGCAEFGHGRDAFAVGLERVWAGSGLGASHDGIQMLNPGWV
jgi:hypothetical protein